MTKPVAILCSDLHLQESAPVARSAEPDWYKAMLRPIKQLRDAAAKYDVPVVCAGDVFDYWKAPPEVINFALEELPDMFAVPGQHDLPLHQMRDLHKSAFGTLVQAGKIKLLQYDKPYLIKGAYLWGFPWDTELRVPNTLDTRSGNLNVAVVHAYVWQKDAGYPGAPETKRVGCYHDQLKGFDVAVFGDNHIPFLRHFEDMAVFNHGGFMRRKINEQDLQPAFGLLMSNGRVELLKQDVSKDRFIERKVDPVIEQDEKFLHTFLEELNALGHTKLDFLEAVQHYLRTYEISDGARELILETIHR